MALATPAPHRISRSYDPAVLTRFNPRFRARINSCTIAMGARCSVLPPNATVAPSSTSAAASAKSISLFRIGSPSIDALAASSPFFVAQHIFLDFSGTGLWQVDKGDGLRAFEVRQPLP